MRLFIDTDACGNRVVKIKPHNTRGFSIQTNGMLPYTHGMCYGEIKDKQSYINALQEISDFVSEYGTKRQKKIMIRG